MTNMPNTGAWQKRVVSTVVKQEIKKEISLKPSVTYRNLLDGIKKEKWEIIYKEAEDMEVFGITSFFGGSTLLSVASEGGRYVTFFARIFPKGNRCEVLAIAGGSETWLGYDYGRNKKVVQKILDMCLGKSI
jgi:hypothetical protein